eukprot:TRINITY_DN2551_c0_g2_i1.p1 TRINITY_DN2551_c0_g2~~TRINITY_DN2551_c0_g2_i1.p1  ORF type:complete len:460 (-),score=80.43 TRINITY_DN2551_c0_g2_i1:63-1442(-)
MPENADSAAFIAHFGLDEKCSSAFSGLTAGDQQIVMEIVNKQTECKNPSAFTWSIVRKIQQNPGSIKLNFITPRLDEKCLKEMEALPRHVQEQIASQVDVERCRNLSAFVFSQIRHMRDQVGMMSSPRVPMPPPMPRGGNSFRDARSRSPYGGGGYGGSLAHESTPDLMARMAAMQQELTNRQVGGRGRTAVAPSGPSQWASPTQAQGGGMMGLDPQAQEALASLDPEGQQIANIIMSSKAGTRNPSAAMWSTVKQVKADRWQAKAAAVRASLDESALAGFQSLSQESQSAVVESVDVAKCRNISAFVWSRIKTGEYGEVVQAQRPQPRGNSLPGVAKVAPDSSSGLDERCEQELRSLPQDVQDSILAEVPPNCRNVSAYVWSKVKQFKQPQGAHPTRREDGTPQMTAAALGLDLDEKCAAEFNQLPGNLQQSIVSEVPAQCRNISAWVWTRIKAFKGR